MKNWYLILLLFTACSVEIPSNDPVRTKKDSIVAVRVLTYIDTLRGMLDRSNTDNKELRAEHDSDVALIDTLQLQVKKGQVTGIQLLIVENRLRKMGFNVKKLNVKIDLLNKQLQDSRDSNTNISSKLEIITVNNRQLAYERNAAQQQIEKASELKIDHERIYANELKRVKSYSIRRPHFRDTAMYFETDKASKVVQVIVSFSIPKNSLLASRTFNFRAVVHGNNVDKGVTERVSITYNGNGADISIPFNQKIEWKAAIHDVEIFNDNELLYKGTLTLK